MTYLQIFQKLIQESGISGVQPTTTVGQVGMVNRFAGWVNDAWIDIQEERDDFKFMEGSFSFNTDTARTYSLTDLSITDFSRFELETLKIYDTSAGLGDETILPYMDYTYWSRYHDIGEVLTGRPSYFVVNPSDNSITLDTAPAETFTITGKYYKAPTELSGDTDVPDLPVQFHRAIVYRALWYYGIFVASAEATSGAEEKYEKMLRKIMKNQVPNRKIKSRPLVW